MMDVQTGDTEASTLIRLQSLGLSDTHGKHRVQAEVNRLEQETRFLEEELEQLEKVETASMSCKEEVDREELDEEVEEYKREIDAASARHLGRCDGMTTKKTIGSLNPSWDRWFEGFQEAEGCNCRIM